MATIYNQISANQRKTWLIMFLFSAFIAGVVYVFTISLGYQGPGALGWVGFALIITGLANLGSYYYSDKIVMAISGAKLIEKTENPRLYNLVENLCIGEGVPVPKIYLIEDTAPNAFATGRDPEHAAIAVTSGLLTKLNKLELEGVLGHELSHIKNYDTRLMTIVTILVGMVALLADWFIRVTWYGGRRNREDRSSGTAIFMLLGIILAILAPLIGTLIQLAVSRRREFLADASSALLTRYPDALADALLKISQDREPLEVANKATAHLYIVNPLKGLPAGRQGQQVIGWFAGLFNTHPPIEERVKALREM